MVPGGSGVALGSSGVLLGVSGVMVILGGSGWFWGGSGGRAWMSLGPVRATDPSNYNTN